MNTKRALVTGATGFSGSHTILELLRRGYEVVGTDTGKALRDHERLDILRRAGVPLEHPALSFIPADLLKGESLAALFDRPPTHIFHTASLYDYSASLEVLRQINVEGTRNLLEHAAETEGLQRFVHWSTCGVFGKPYTAADGRLANVPFSEESPSPRNSPPDATEPAGTHLVNAYSVTKWEQEKLVWRAHREQRLPVTVVRPAPIYGPGSDYGHGGIIIAIAKGYVPAIPGDARNFITTSVHVSDVARFAAHAVELEETIGEDYNVVDDSIISYHEFLHYIALLTGRRLRDLPLIRLKRMRPFAIAAARFWTWLERSFGIPRVRILEVQSATYISSSYWISNRKTLSTGFEYLYPDVREGLKDTIAWMRGMGWLAR